MPMAFRPQTFPHRLFCKPKLYRRGLSRYRYSAVVYRAGNTSVWRCSASVRFPPAPTLEATVCFRPIADISRWGKIRLVIQVLDLGWIVPEVQFLDAENDEEALSIARSMRPGMTREIWDRHRL